MTAPRYLRSIGAVTEEEFQILQNSRIFVAGCGGLGGHLIAHLLRIGIGQITAIDSDIFEPTNMNRQLLCTTDTLGCSKAEAAVQYAAQVNPEAAFTGICTRLDETNCDSLITGHDLVLDALDNIGSRKTLAASCDRIGIPMICGGISGWSAQITVLPPGTAERRMEQIYPPSAVIKDKSCLSFTPSFCASVQTAEAIKVLLKKPSELNGSLLFTDLMSGDFTLIPLV